MHRRFPILEKLAELYASSTLGKTGISSRDFSIAYRDLLEKAASTSGDAWVLAKQDLAQADGVALLIEKHRRSHEWQRIRVSLEHEPALFARIQRESPSALRARWSRFFTEAIDWPVPEKYRLSWTTFCLFRAANALQGIGWSPFRITHLQRAKLQLRISAELLAWEHPSLLRTASVRLTGDSKFLERSLGTFEKLLTESTGSIIRSFGDLQIEHNPGFVRFHGPVRLHLRGSMTDYTPLLAPTISDRDLSDALRLETNAPRCITVENATKFHELCRLDSGDIFVLTSYPNAATIAFLRALPATVALHHFGDTDPWGFDVLLKLRELTALPITALHMRYRPKADSPLLTPRDQRKLAALLTHPALSDVRSALEQLRLHKRKGDFEQESLDLANFLSLQ